jgi:hypothetical protein
MIGEVENLNNKEVNEMSKINLPGFTAEASLTPTATYYRARTAGAPQVFGVVIPQLPFKCVAACFCCFKYHNSFCCNYCEICSGIFDVAAPSSGTLAPGI